MEYYTGRITFPRLPGVLIYASQTFVEDLLDPEFAAEVEAYLSHYYTIPCSPPRSIHGILHLRQNPKSIAIAVVGDIIIEFPPENIYNE